MKKAALLLASLYASASAPADGFGPRTHVYIADQVYRELLENNCRLSIAVAGAVPEQHRLLRDVPHNVCHAILTNRGAFLAGSIGPDAFPDLIVGQSFVHPGTPGGRTTADWLDHLLRNAESDEEIAFAYGNTLHAAGDAFAHSYVNNYAGRTFDLKRFPRNDVENRHTILERYIDQRLAYQADVSALRVPHEFVVRTMVRQSYIPGYVSITAEQLLALARNPVRQVAGAVGSRVAAALPASHLTTMWRILEVAEREARGAPCAQVIATLNLVKAYRDLVAAEHAARSPHNPRHPAMEQLPQVVQSRCVPLTREAYLDPVLRRSDAAEIARQLEEAEALMAQSIAAGRLEPNDAAVNEREHWWRSVPRQRQADLREADRAFRRAAELRDRARALGVFAPLWAANVETAIERYVEASLLMARGMVRSGEPVPPAAHERVSSTLHHRRWFTCYRPVFFGEPVAAADARCGRMREMGPALTLSQAARQLAIGELPRGLLYRYLEFSDWLSDQMSSLLLGVTRLAAPSVAGLIEALTDPTRVSRYDLDRAFRGSGNGQLRFRCVSDLIDADLGLLTLTGGENLRDDQECLRVAGPDGRPTRVQRTGLWLDPQQFLPLQYAITLSQLSLLDAGGIRELATSVAPEAGIPRTGSYRRYSILLDTVQSIDGSYQWHPRQMPYPRRRRYSVTDIDTDRSGYPVASPGALPLRERTIIAASRDPGIDRDRPGFPFYQTEPLRRLVFSAIFPGPFEGEILRRPEFNPPRYPFRPCPGDPFRTPQRGTGRTVPICDLP